LELRKSGTEREGWNLNPSALDKHWDFDRIYRI
jgi:hypothetical protein